MVPSFPLPFEKVHWRTRRYGISDFRLVALRRGAVTGEIALHDIASITVAPSLVERLTGVGTLVIAHTRPHEPGLRLACLVAARQAALRLNLLLADTRGVPPDDGLLTLPMPSLWRVQPAVRLHVVLVGPVVLLLTIVAIGIGLSGHEVRVAYAPHDPIRPNGMKRSEAEIVAFMKDHVMPWAREALEPTVGRGNVRCETCHGLDARATRTWVMPAVTALPEPAVRRMATAAGSDSQVRNALHGYLAEEDNLTVAAHMRGVVMPGMARLLRRPMYDFAQTYEYNHSRAAFGCYHCHMVKED